MSKEEKKASNVQEDKGKTPLVDENNVKQEVVGKPKLYRIEVVCKTSPKFPSGKKLLTITRAMDDSDALAIGQQMLAEQLSGKISVKLV